MKESEKFIVQVIASPGVRIMQPIGVGKLVSQFAKEDEQRFDFSETINGELNFIGDDYHYFKKISDSQRRYDDIRINVSNYCAGQYKKILSGFASIKDATFDDHKCSVKIKVTVRDRYQLFDDNGGDVYNLFAITADRTAANLTFPSVSYINGIPLQSALFALLREALGATALKSDFFQWNPDDPGYIYGNSALLHNLVLFQQSDIILAAEPGYVPATNFEMKLSDLVRDVCTMLNLRYQIDENNNFRIEHVSWFTSGSTFDLTQEKYKDTVFGKVKFSFDKPEIYRKEVFIAPDSKGKDFVGVPIVYDNAFTRTLTKEFSTVQVARQEQEQKKEKVYELKVIKTDFQTVSSLNKDDDGNREGCLLVATNDDGELFKIDAILPGAVDQWNNVLAWAQIHDSFYRFGRLFQEGNMNGVDETFTNTQPIKLQEELHFKLCCNETINLNSKFLTQLGEGEIISLTIDRFNGFARVVVGFPYNGETIIDAPIAVDDNYATFMDDPIDTDAESLPTLIANDTGAVSALSETKDTSRGGTVQILGDGNFIYTPPAGQFGIDSFEYVALDADGHADFAKANIILKTEDVYVHLFHYSRTITLVVGDPPTPTDYILEQYIFRFYSDPTLLVPLDLTGYGITINATSNDPVPATPFSFLAVGYDAVVGGGFPSSVGLVVNLLPGTGYTVV